MAEAEVGLRATLKDRAQTARGLRDVEQGVDRVGRSAETAGRRARLGSRGFDAMRSSGKLAASAIKVGFGVALAAGYGVVRLLRSSFEEAREAQKVGAITKATIKSLGREAAVSARHVDRLSTRLSLMAGIDDEIIQGGANVLLRYTQVRNELGKGNKVYDRATAAATDMAAALAGGSGGEINVAGAAKTVGKALADPEKGIAALRKAQIVLTQSQQDSIKSMVEQGDTLGAQKVILGAIEDRYKGTAKAQATWGDKAKVLFQNIEERLGTALLPLLDDVERWFVRKGGPALDKYVGIFEDKGVPAIKHFADESRPLVKKLLPSLSTGLGDVRDVLSAAAPYAADLVGAFKDMPSWARKALVGGALAGFVGSKTGVTSAVKGLLGSPKAGGGGLLGLASKAKPLPVYVVNEGFGGTGGGGGKGGKLGTVTKTAAGTAAGSAGLGAAALVGVPAAFAASAYAAHKTLEHFFPDDFDRQADEFTNHMAEIAAAEGGVGTNADPQAASAYLKAIEGGVYRADAAIAATDVHTKNLGKSLDKTGRTKVNPTFDTPGLPAAQERTSTYGGLLEQIAHPVMTHISADTSSALSSVNALAAHTAAVLNNAVSGFFGSGGTSTPTTPPPTTPPDHPRTTVPRTPRTTGTTDLDRQPVPRLGRTATIEVPVYLNGREIARAVRDQDRRDLDDR